MQDTNLYDTQFDFNNTASLIAAISEQTLVILIKQRRTEFIPMEKLEEIQRVLDSVKLDQDTRWIQAYRAVYEISAPILKPLMLLLNKIQSCDYLDKRQRLQFNLKNDLVRLQSSLREYRAFMAAKDAENSQPKNDKKPIKVPTVCVVPVPPPPPPIGNPPPVLVSSKPPSQLQAIQPRLPQKLKPKLGTCNLQDELKNGKDRLRVLPTGRTPSGGPKEKNCDPQIVTANDILHQALQERFKRYNDEQV